MSEHLHGPVLASHVGQLVEEEGATPILRPMHGAGRKQDRRLPETMDDRNPHRVAHQKTDAAPQPQHAGRFLDLDCPVRFDQLRGSLPGPPREKRRSADLEQADKDADDPGEGEPGKDRPGLVTDSRGRQPSRAAGDRDRGGGSRRARSVTFRRARSERSDSRTRIPRGCGALRCAGDWSKKRGPTALARTIGRLVPAGRRAPSSAARSRRAAGREGRSPSIRGPHAVPRQSSGGEGQRRVHPTGGSPWRARTKGPST